MSRTTARGPSAWGGSSPGGGSGAPANGPYVTTAADGALSNETLIGAIILPPDVFANRPSATGLIAGTLFFSTDTATIYRADGAGVWVVSGTFVERAHGVVVVGTGASPVTDPNTARPTAAVVRWMMDTGVEPVNAIDGDEIWTEGDTEFVQTIEPGDGIEVDDTEPAAPVVSVSSTSSIGFVNHGATAATARPSGYTSVIWLGTVEPDNWIAGDFWEDPS
jgi:hypothetical protein